MQSATAQSGKLNACVFNAGRLFCDAAYWFNAISWTLQGLKISSSSDELIHCWSRVLG